MNKIFLKTLILTAIFSFIAPLFVSADGMVIMPGDYGWGFRDEESQTAFINYQDGIEKMIISTGLKEDTKDSVWLFPVPAIPQKVVIDVITQTPSWYGSSVDQKAKHNLEEIKNYLYLSQIYPSIFRPRYIGYSSYDTINALPSLGVGEQKTDVATIDVYEHLEKEGITTEIITAKTGDAIYTYLKNKNLNIEAGSIPVLDSYVGKDFTFVVSWISEVKNETRINEIDSYYYKASKKGVFVAFPTEKIYFPLMPTSVYESKVVPATIYINGFVTPKIFQDIKPYTTVGYFMNNYVYGAEPQIFYGNNSDVNKFTRIEINSPSKLLTEDLFVKNSAPAGVNYDYFIAKYSTVIFVLIFVILSFLSGTLSGLVVFKEARSKKGWFKFSILGFTNLLSIIGLIVATVFVPTKSIRAEDKDLFFEFKKRGYNTKSFRIVDARKILFLIAFSLIFTVMSFLSVALLKVLI